MRKTRILAVCALLIGACGTDAEEEPTTRSSATSTPIESAGPSGDATSSSAPAPSGTTESDDPVATEEPLTLLVVGLDADSGSQRADVTMLVRIDGDREHLTAMSIPRDTWVEIPGHGENKINAAYAFGEEELLSLTISDLYSAEIDHVMAVDFEAFTELSSILGPIEVETADGVVTLEGEEALSFVRERKSLPAGDFDRVRRQQAYLAGVSQSLREAGPAELAQLAELAGEYIEVDGRSGISAQALLLSLFDDAAGTEQVFFSAPHAGTGWSEDGQSIVLVDAEETQQIAEAYESDTVAEWVEESQAETLDSRPVN